MKSCLNCGQPFAEECKFCSQCGQKTAIRMVSFWNIIRDFFSNLFNIDNKIWQTLKDIWIPAKLTDAYIAGKRVKYYNPLRIFIIVLFAFFALLLFYNNESISKVDAFKKKMEKSFWMDNLIVKFDSLTINSTIESDTLLRLKANLLDYKEKLNEEYGKIFDDSLKLNPDLSEKQILNLKDSLQKLQMFNADKISDDNGIVQVDLSDGNNGIIFDNVQTSDVYSLSAEEFKKKYGKGDWANTMFISQVQKIMQNPSASIKFMIGNGTWAIVIMILFMAFFYKIIYLRHNILFAEHFIFQVYGHTRILLLCIAGLILNSIFDISNIWLYPVLLAGLIYMYKGMRKFYRQSRIKTLAKLSFSLLAYLFIITTCVSVILSISIFIF